MVLVSPLESGGELSQSTYMLDGGFPDTFTEPSPNETIYRVQFYNITTQDTGPHTLVVTNLIEDSLGIRIDYVQYLSAPQTKTTTNPSPSSSTSPISNSLTSNQVSTAAAATSSALSQRQRHHLIICHYHYHHPHPYHQGLARLPLYPQTTLSARIK